jgi:hypothetical protein
VSRAGRILRWGLLALVPVMALIVWALIWFLNTHYPTMGLAGIPKQDYQVALEKVARGMTAVEGLRFVALDLHKFREAGKSGDARAWGTARCLAKDGSTSFFWVSLEWDNGRGQWRRGFSQELAGPEDEIYFTRESPGQSTRGRLALAKLLGQLAGHIREARGL